MKFNKLFMFMMLMLPAAGVSFAQENSTADTTLESYIRSLNQLKSEVEFLKKIKINGWVQAQYQRTDTLGAANVAGGNFAPGSDNRIILRRGRIKFTHESNYAQYVLQVDVIDPTPTNPTTSFAVNVRDFYTKVTLPFYKPLSFTVGMQNRPFGYEIAYSSQFRETPERSRFVQMLFPNERDLGAMLTWAAANTSKWHGLKINAGFFNGTGIAREFDSKKDFMGQIIYNRSTKNEKVQYGIGVSYYNGGVREVTNVIYKDISTDMSGNIAYVKDSSKVHNGQYAKRNYIGADAQISFDTKLGLTTLRGEYVSGTQPGVLDATRSPEVQPATDAYIRSFNAGYFYFIHKIAKAPFQVVFKYDWYDPNTKVKGNEVRSAGKFGQGDIKYTTYGYGVNYLITANLKLMAYYDRVINEATHVTNFYTDKKDNVYTLRIQYRF
ncbi:MAG: OprO/OprP family phosphate-selective porin [Bacteroidia bacterium]|nr:OprO/OprP family phosphate-selective porin [Bacteroidia bacterium]